MKTKITDKPKYIGGGVYIWHEGDQLCLGTFLFTTEEARLTNKIILESKARIMLRDILNERLAAEDG